MRILFVENFSESNPEGFVKEIKEMGHLIGKNIVNPDIIFSASIFKMLESIQAKANYPEAKLVVYCWDFYKWAWEGKHNLDWKRYAEFLRQADKVLVPSEGQKLRLKEMLDIDSVVCECSVPFYNHFVNDNDYVLDPVRDYPEENLGWVKKACEELEIPYIHTEHGYTEAEFRNLVSNCTFMTCGYREASTGGLSLMEGLYNGKISLVSNSPYMGAKSYLGDLGYYFQYDDYEDLKSMISYLWKNRPTISLTVAREHCKKFTDKQFALRLLKEYEN